MANLKTGNFQLGFELIGWTSPARQHEHSIWIQPATPPSVGDQPDDIDIMLLGGGTETLDNVAQLHWDFLRLQYDSVIVCVGWTLWRYDTEFARTFITSGAVVSPTGSGGGVQVARYLALTFRTALGGIIKHIIMEGNAGGNNRAALIPNPTGTAQARYAAYVMSASSPIIGLDNSFPVTPLRDSRGENELLFRTVFRG